MLHGRRCCWARVRSNSGPQGPSIKDMSQENWLDAIDKFKDILEEISDPYTVLEAIASCYDGLDNYLMAAEYYEKALAVCPESRRLPLHYHLGSLEAAHSEQTKPSRLSNNAWNFRATQRPKNTSSKRLIFSSRSRKGNRGPTLLSSSSDAEGFCRHGSRQLRVCRRPARTLAGIDPENAVIFYNLGVVYTFLKREDDALTEFQRSVDLYPGYYQAWYNMGQICLIKKNDISRAFHCFDRATTIRPDYIGAHHQKGTVCETPRRQESGAAMLGKDPATGSGKQAGQGQHPTPRRRQTGDSYPQ